MAGQIFSGNINALAISWMMIYMLMFAVAWEAWCGFLTEKAGDNRAQQEMLSKVAKELMILGFIAFGVILLKEFNVFVWNSATLLTFEFCDLLISICVLIYVANCFISSLTLATTQRRWDRMAMTKISVVVRDVKEYLGALDGSCWRKFVYHLPVVGHHWRLEADFKTMQLIFESGYHLPAHFDYVDYMKLVLQNVVISMANVSTWHWLLLMFINFVWWVVLTTSDAGTPDDHICLFTPDCTSSGDDHRRRLAPAADACPCMNNTKTEPDDIGATETLHWLWLFVAIGWLIVVMQGLVVHILNNKMQKILSYAGADSDSALGSLLEHLGGEVEKHAHSVAVHLVKQTGSKAAAEEGALPAKTDGHPTPKHHVTVDETVSKEELLRGGAVDHIISFKNGKQSDDIMSLRNYEAIMFFTKFMQLMIDFYLGFYVVHMRLRVRRAYGLEKASDGDILPQLLFHAAQIVPVVLTLYFLMLTTRKIALLLGVLHKDDEAVGEVLHHMEQVRGLRNRIRDALASTHPVARNPNPTEAHKNLQKAKEGEIALLRLLDEKYSGNVRIDHSVVVSVYNQYNQSLSFSEKDVTDFLKTGDSTTLRELGVFVLGYCSDIVGKAQLLQASDEEVDSIEYELTQLSCVDSAMLQQAKEMSRAKKLFRAADVDGGGTVGRLELFFTLRRFKVPVTKAEFAQVFRVIDPDQSHSINMEEWLEFMSATDSDINRPSSGGSNPRP